MGAKPEAEQVEDIAEVDAESVEMIVEDAQATESDRDDRAVQCMQADDEDAYTVQHIVDPSRTTEQILRDLYADPNVISAEPNYLIENPGPTENEQGVGQEQVQAATEAQSAPKTGLKAEAAPGPVSTMAASTIDLTPYEWYTDETQPVYTAPLSKTSGYSLNVPGWASDHMKSDAPFNSSGTVCVMDTGMDITHPDLQGVLFDFSTLPAGRYNELRRAYGISKYGMNASGSGASGDVTDHHYHGTHVAGIIAGEWNDFGVSGVANGTKLFCVRIFGDDGISTDTVSELKGFQFLIDVAKDVNLKAVNCSWGNMKFQYAVAAMTNELGKQGVNTVFASGNRSADLDKLPETGSQAKSPYVITVDAALPNGKITDFSCYGRASTHVFAPGAGLMSTVAQTPVSMLEGSVYSSWNFTRFYPESTADDGLLYGTEQFASDQTDLLFFKSNPAIDQEAERIDLSIDVENGYYDSRSAQFSLGGDVLDEVVLGKTEGEVPRVELERPLYMAIPLVKGDASDVKWVSATIAFSDPMKPNVAISSITCKKSDESGAPIEIGKTASAIMQKGYETGAVSSGYVSQWSNLSCNVDGFLEASNELHEKLESMSEQEIEEWFINRGATGYVDPGKVDGLYVWEYEGRSYIIAKLAITYLDVSKPSITDETALLVDNVAVGNQNAATGAYIHMSGTSMAAPTVTGSLAVIANGEPESSSLRDDELALEARERAAKLLAAVDYDDDLAPYCRTGARVNLKHQTEFVKKAPLIASSTEAGNVLTVEGYFFGSAGELYVDGSLLATTSYSDSKVTADLSGLGLSNGSHAVKIVNADGAAMSDLFSYSGSDPENGRPLFENTLSLPLSKPAFVADGSARLYGQMAVCDGSLYAMAVDERNEGMQALWRYDIAENWWSRCADLPDELKGRETSGDALVALGGFVYAYGNDIIEDSVLWRYDPGADAWNKVDAPIPSKSTLCVHDGKLFFLGGYFGNVFEDLPESEDVTFALLDLDAEALIKLDTDGVAPDSFDESNSNVASSNKYMYWYCPSYDGQTGYLGRLAYDEANAKVSVTDMTDTLKKANAYNLINEAHKGDLDHPIEHIKLAGLPYGVAIIASSTSGDDDNVGKDTHVVYDDNADALAYKRTSSFFNVNGLMAAYADGQLFAIGHNAAEPDVMFFRSTSICADGQNTEHSWGDPTDVDATCAARGARIQTCSHCGAVKSERISDALGHEWSSWTRLSDTQHKRTCARLIA